MKIESKTVHWGDRRKAGNFMPSTTPIYTASSYVYDSVDQLDRVFVAGRIRAVVRAFR